MTLKPSAQNPRAEKGSPWNENEDRPYIGESMGDIAAVEALPRGVEGNLLLLNEQESRLLTVGVLGVPGKARSNTTILLGELGAEREHSGEALTLASWIHRRPGKLAGHSGESILWILERGDSNTAAASEDTLLSGQGESDAGTTSKTRCKRSTSDRI